MSITKQKYMCMDISNKTLLIGGGGSYIWLLYGYICRKLKDDNNYLKKYKNIVGVSAGGFLACLIISGINLEVLKMKYIDMFYNYKKKLRENNQQTNLTFKENLKLLKQLLIQELPQNAYILCSNKLHLIATKVNSLFNMKKICYNTYSSNNDLLDKLFKMSYLPYICGNSFSNDGIIDGFDDSCIVGCCCSNLCNVTYLCITIFRKSSIHVLSSPSVEFINNNFHF